ncbi:uncharacterized protein CTRU02_203665 [Colletotrichum truncatum]|uniref:Uncharacterized protein n=1 Tax=Colletotrichum truncatum TaxID=5467 RepID=A0ACC3Z9Z5_COLTU|nr:uncharacterized protein CTRU02_03998 [Colletotrichum truncatum]KAF6796038.1 hypothetical protein CTRU02_03998 [Colletotrichum truncatum]
MAPTQKEPAAAAPKLPNSTDFNAIYNRISLASAKQTTFLNSMRAKYPSLARSSSSSSPSSAAVSAPATNANGTFSSLSKPTLSTPTTATPQSGKARSSADESDLRFENPNAGLGYTASNSEEKTSAATRDLGRRLLGKRGREVDNKAAAQKRRVQDDESEEEEGRSGLGRKKKKRARTEEEDDDEEAGEESPAADDVQQREGADMSAGVPEKNAEVPPPDQEKPAAGIVREDGKVSHDAQPETSEPKKKKNKKKKKKKAGGSGDA